MPLDSCPSVPPEARYVRVCSATQSSGESVARSRSSATAMAAVLSLVRMTALLGAGVPGTKPAPRSRHPWPGNHNLLAAPSSTVITAHLSCRPERLSEIVGAPWFTVLHGQPNPMGVRSVDEILFQVLAEGVGRY